MPKIKLLHTQLTKWALPTFVHVPTALLHNKWCRHNESWHSYKYWYHTMLKHQITELQSLLSTTLTKHAWCVTWHMHKLTFRMHAVTITTSNITTALHSVSSHFIWCPQFHRCSSWTVELSPSSSPAFWMCTSHDSFHRHLKTHCSRPTSTSADYCAHW